MNWADEKRYNPESQLSRRELALMALALLLFALVFGTLLNFPAAWAAHVDLRSAYGAKRAHLTTVKVAELDTACGYYTVGSNRRWRYLETRNGLWAEEQSPEWRRAGEKSSAGIAWRRCIQHQPRRGPDWILTVAAPVTILLLRFL